MQIMQRRSTRHASSTCRRKWSCGPNKTYQASISNMAMQRKKLSGMWDTEKMKDPKFGAAYEKKSRDHAVRQTGAKDEIVETLNRNGRRSYSSLEKAINSWCSNKAIERYLKSMEDYHTYLQNVRLLLSEGNRLKQVNFSKHVRNRWGLPTGTHENSLDNEVS